MAPIHVSDARVPGPHGPVRVRLYEPSDPPVAGLVWLHGGAFCMGDLDVPEADWVARELAGVGVAVVSVDYRLAVDGVHFPVPSDDVLAAWAWVVETEPLGLDVRQWHLGGGSAGANLAASATLQLRDRGAPMPRSDVLVYPVMHQVLPEAAPELAWKVAALPADQKYSTEQSDELNLNYVGTAELLGHPYAFPANAALEGLPPTLIVNSDQDGLRASGQAFAAALASAGVDVAMVREVGVRHGHLNDKGSPGARRTIARMATWLHNPELTGEAHEAGLQAAATGGFD